MSVDLYQLKREHANFNSALDVLYMMYLASKSENLDMERYSSALRAVWLHMNRIEERVSALLESDKDAVAIRGNAAAAERDAPSNQHGETAAVHR